MIQLVPYRADLHESLLTFLAHCLPESGRTFDPQGRHAHLLDIEHAFEALWCLLENGKEVVGCVGVRPLDEGICELKTLFVYERLQGHGFGRQLAERAISYAREQRYSAVRLDTISTSTNALALYHKLGFHDIARYDDNPQADVFMELSLSHSSN